MDFELHPNLAQKDFVIDLPLCRVLLENNRDYPWIFLVPRRVSISKIMDLSHADQLQLLCELDMAQKILWKQFQPHQINVAAIGNKTPQLHIHVIARNENDPAWPNTVWDHPHKIPYDPSAKQQIIEVLREAFS